MQTPAATLFELHYAAGASRKTCTCMRIIFTALACSTEQTAASHNEYGGERVLVVVGVLYLGLPYATMTSKLDYLQKYLSKGESLGRDDGDKPKKKKKKKLKSYYSKKGGNLAIVDDDVDWRALVPKEEAECSAGEDDPEDKPVVAEVRCLYFAHHTTRLSSTLPTRDRSNVVYTCTLYRVDVLPFPAFTA